MDDLTSEDLCHEVRTPLTTIANSANLLLYRMQALDAAGGARTDASVAEMRALVTTILDEVGRAERGVLVAAWAVAHDPRVEVLLRFEPDVVVRVDNG